MSKQIEDFVVHLPEDNIFPRLRNIVIDLGWDLSETEFGQDESNGRVYAVNDSYHYILFIHPKDYVLMACRSGYGTSEEDLLVIGNTDPIHEVEAWVNRTGIAV
tara:strand:+ start:437 stop:748 length:312 start_codon:yes stop_codon:yes gene_type:complete